MPTPSNVNVLRMSDWPSPFSKIWTFNVPERPADVVNCMINTRPLESGRPFGVLFKMYHAPPVLVSITTSWPSIAEPEANAATYGWAGSSTVPIATSSPVGWLSIPIVNQLSAAIVGNTAMNAGLMPLAKEAPKASL